jgi:hypothetical protein
MASMSFPAEDDSILSQAEGKLILVDGTKQTNLGCRRHVDATAAKSCGDGM